MGATHYSLRSLTQISTGIGHHHITHCNIMCKVSLVHAAAAKPLGAATVSQYVEDNNIQAETPSHPRLYTTGSPPLVPRPARAVLRNFQASIT
jgi:hypothetical protein